MKKFKTEKGIVLVEIKNKKPVFTLPQGMHGEIWASERQNILSMLNKPTKKKK